MRFMMMLGTLVVSSRQVIDTMLLCKMVYVVLFASFCLVCYAQNQLEQVRFSNINQLPCWRRSDGCQTDYLRRFSSSDCASVILAPDSHQIVCVPYLSSSSPTTTTVVPSSYSIEKLLRSLNNERNMENRNQLTSGSSSSSKFEQIPNFDRYYTAYREGEENSYKNIDDDDMRKYKEENLDECNESASDFSEIRRERCLKKNDFEQQKMRTNNRGIGYGPIIYGDSIAKEEEDDRDSLSSVRQKTGSKVPVVSIRPNREIREGQLIEGEEKEIDLSEPAILIASRGLAYDQYRLRRPTFRLTHRNEGKRQQQQQVSVDLDGGQRINKSNNTTSQQDTLIRGNKSKIENNHNNPKSTGNIGNKETQLECNKRQYTFKAVKRDDLGNKCSGILKATICYGSCDTGEIADWIFPFKKSIHKVCSHGQRVRRRVILPECSSSSVDPSLREYHYVDAKTCVCQKCNPAETTCLGSLTRPYLMSSNEFGGGSGKSSDSDGIEQTISEAELIY